MKSKIAIFFIVLFTGIIITPSIITLVDKDQDITIFLNLSEEEENTKHVKVAELKAHPNEDYTSFLYKKIQKKKNVRFLSKNYVSQYPKILTPPPELLIA
ncbi:MULTISPECIES: hypothetical protein [Tenacibaculum]|uniref:Uncharacterized protein n=1 Tax=Tenacibaculum mesophilum TaxID=104268 RepID=A0AAE9SFG5_9FLAO|nr:MULTISPECIES: hypothetical protein [Tenacibaculum]MCO7183974.1 hypothetical protein [Tenacibaculum sp. XPcli2-G]UTD15507.1 hypothetical protein HER15_08520 [Tenacibaculum mesophilum]BFF36332.1 hypothetical protein BACT7_11940 [Tenacibaculum mesophilum]